MYTYGAQCRVRSVDIHEAITINLIRAVRVQNSVTCIKGLIVIQHFSPLSGTIIRSEIWTFKTLDIEILMETSIKMTASWDTAPCTVVEGDRNPRAASDTIIMEMSISPPC